VAAAVKDDAGQIIGYLVRWRRLAATAEARQQFLALIGARAEIYVGNIRGDVWTNLLTTAPLPPENVRSASEVTHYTREGGIAVAAVGHPVSGTPWLVVVEFPLGEITAQADRFLRRIAIVGLVLFALGLLGAWALSRSITRPLHGLTEASLAISGGDYSRLVEVERRDELGALASSFNTMVVQVRESQHGLEQNVQQRTAQLEAANRELEAFSYSVSHDLRAPLRAVDGFSRILEEDYADKLDDEGRRVLGVIRNSAQNMGKLIDDLLAFSRLGRKRLEAAAIEMGELAGEVYAQLEANSDVGSISMNIMPLPKASGDRAMIRQVFANLLSNALKYSRPKAARVVEVGGRSENGENIYYVRDNGVGFDKQYANKLFGVFQRLHSAEEFEGTGVGLAIVQRIIHRHGGRVWADGEEGAGATFYFTLPLEKVDGGDGEQHGHQ
jgi:signal transduction histidine kinase